MLPRKLKIKIFADGANLQRIEELSTASHIKGFTTNPTLMRKAGIVDYVGFAKRAIDISGGKPISFEVFSDDFNEMLRQALEINSWSPNVYVKIPVCDSTGKLNLPIIKELISRSVKVNITAVMTRHQVESCLTVLESSVPSYVSVFAGRIADTGVDPIETMKASLMLTKSFEKCEVIWASPREILNIFQAEEIGCHIITITEDILSKLKLVGLDLNEFSIETVKMFHDDAKESRFII